MSQSFNEDVSNGILNDSVKELANALKKLTLDSEELFVGEKENNIKTEFASALEQIDKIDDDLESNNRKTEFASALGELDKIDIESDTYNDKGELEFYDLVNEFTVDSEDSNIWDNEKTEFASALSELDSLDIESDDYDETGFKVVNSNLPAKVNFWTKVRNIMFYEIKVELTPRQQKIEDDINNFLHKEITWDSFKNFWTQEVPITYKGKRIF